jgi:hypothetical protein
VQVVVALVACALLSLACASTSSEVEAVGPVKVRVGAIAPNAFDAASSPPDGAVDRVERLVDLFFQAGCVGDQLTQTRAKGGRYPDVVCRLPGRDPDAIVVAAYVDPSERRGEDWSGAALLPQLYRALSVQKREHSYVFVGFGQNSRRGMRTDAERLAESDQDRVRALVDLQRLRLGPSSSSLLFSSADANLRQDLGAVGVALGVPRDSLRFVQVPDPRRHDVPMIALASPKDDDDAASVDPREAYRGTGRMIAIFLAYLDDTLRLRGAEEPPAIGVAAPPTPEPL